MSSMFLRDSEEDIHAYFLFRIGTIKLLNNHCSKIYLGMQNSMQVNFLQIEDFLGPADISSMGPKAPHSRLWNTEDLERMQ